MADNTELNAGSGGDTIGSDDIGGVKYQRVKLIVGGDGVNDGDVASGNPMPTNPSDRAARDNGKVDIASLDTLPSFDMDSGGGTATHQAIGIAVAASGGPALITGDASNGLDVDVTRVGGNVTVVDGGGSLSVDDGGSSLTVDGTVAVTNADIATIAGAIRAEDVASADGHAGIVVMATRKATPANVSGTDGDYEMLQMSAGRLWASATIDAALPAGNNNIGDVDVASLPSDVAIADDAAFTIATSKVVGSGFLADETSPDSVNEGDIGIARMTLDRKVLVVAQAHTQGGWTPYKLLSAASTNATNVKNAAGQLGYAMVTNINASARFLKIYNKASAPTVGSDTPVHTFLIPGNTSGFTINFGDVGMQLDTGVSFALTTGVADSDNTGVAANEIIVNLGYK